MADQVNTGGGGNAGLGVLVGVLIAAMVILAFFVLGGQIPGVGDRDVDVKIETPAPEGAPQGQPQGQQQGQ